MADLVIVNPTQDRRAVAGRRRVRAGRSSAGVTSRPRASSTSGTTASRASRSSRGRGRRFPQPVMRRQIAVGARRARRAARRAARNARPPRRRPRPSRRRRRAAAPRSGSRATMSQAEIDRVELDMGERVEQRDPPGERAEIAPPLRHLARRAQQRPLRPGRARRRASPSPIAHARRARHASRERRG